LVVELTSPLCTLVLVLESLQVPLSCARAFDMPCRLLGLSLICVEVRSLVPPAALPPEPIVDDVPLGLVEVPPVPSVEAEVPPAAELPALPPVALELDGVLDEPALPIDDALCAKAKLLAVTPTAPASRIAFR
jgi:hypothetical protein